MVPNSIYNEQPNYLLAYFVADHYQRLVQMLAMLSCCWCAATATATIITNCSTKGNLNMGDLMLNKPEQARNCQ
jgi:hypothetical protein